MPSVMGLPSMVKGILYGRTLRSVHFSRERSQPESAVI